MTGHGNVTSCCAGRTDEWITAYVLELVSKKDIAFLHLFLQNNRHALRCIANLPVDIFERLFLDLANVVSNDTNSRAFYHAFCSADTGCGIVSDFVNNTSIASSTDSCCRKIAAMCNFGVCCWHADTVNIVTNAGNEVVLAALLEGTWHAVRSHEMPRSHKAALLHQCMEQTLNPKRELLGKTEALLVSRCILACKSLKGAQVVTRVYVREQYELIRYVRSYLHGEALPENWDGGQMCLSMSTALLNMHQLTKDTLAHPNLVTIDAMELCIDALRKTVNRMLAQLKKFDSVKMCFAYGHDLHTRDVERFMQMDVEVKWTEFERRLHNEIPDHVNMVLGKLFAVAALSSAEWAQQITELRRMFLSCYALYSWTNVHSEFIEAG